MSQYTGVDFIKGTIVIDLSSSSPFDTRELGAELSKLSVDLVDSPITQEALHAIDKAGATLMVGSDSKTALDKALPVLKQMSRHLFVMGGLGSGHIMKTLNNYVSIGSILALCDALVSGQFPYRALRAHQLTPRQGKN
jgi:3-hydroxyisobutyrate dehydrogenase-like beta-hydroxyacid dehydrogenase